MKLVKFHGDAEQELIAAAAYYENQKPTLGRRFLISIQDAINRRSNPYSSIIPITFLNQSIITCNK